ncbi:Terpenoid synthase [Pseudocohnilembus persalinus]|uniref:Terpenoid synthase n=1 Tax=Pseudocohnilembus persalinus TaxID=266149 RepID=A0A0V0QB10_PSEPJ|nr:Terpenoid synthase [Pseudocohnilembus persalinus]|eukprot:KRW99378.1 Terpenoid synthase [Pseudocohnilembus persalinus]
MEQYSEQFNKCGVLEEIVPRKIKEQKEISYYSDNLQYTKETGNDIQGINNALNDPIWNLLDRGGKRWRPTLCIMIAEAYGKKMEDVAEIAALCEIVHNGTLMVDDLEDNSLVRRNQPCTHLLYGNDIAVNAGNFMYFVPFMRLLKSDKFTDKQKLQFSQIYAEEMTNLHLGQGWDICWHSPERSQGYVPTKDQYLQMTSHKTGVLARLSSRLVCTALDLDVESEQIISRFAERIGVAFQIQDDILNIDGEEYLATKGMMGEDIHEGKMSLMVIHSYNNGTKEDSARLLEIVKSKPEDIETIKEAIQLIKKTDSIKFSKQIAEELIQIAWNDGMEKVLPEGDAKIKLKLLAEYNIGRKI